MKKVRIICTSGLLSLMCATNAQKAWHGDINTLTAKVPLPNSSSAGYALCNHTTDPSNGAISISGSGTVITDLQRQLMDALGASASVSATATGAPPTAAQIEQMKQDAMARASAAQSMTPQQAAQMQKPTGSAPVDDPALMRQIGQAQTAAGQITQLVNEMSQKAGKLNKGLDAVKAGSNCPDVQQGGYAGPTCACMKARAQSYEQARTALMDDYMQQAINLVEQYMSRMRPLIAIVDDMVAKAKYGDAVSNPSFRQMVVMTQRQAMGGLTALLSISSGVAEDGARQEANLMNANSGSSVGCFGK
jgi:hypothetical protein